MTLLLKSILSFPLQIAHVLMKQKIFCEAESVIKTRLKIAANLLHSGKDAVNK